MKNTFFLLIIFAAFSCGKNEPTTSEKPEAEATHTSGDLIHLTPDQAKQAGLAFGSFEQKNIAEALRVNAELVVHPEHVAQVTAFSDGSIAELRMSLNATVTKGQVLAVIRKPDLLDLQQQFLENKDRLVFLKNEFDRYKSLKEADATATKNFQKAESDLRAAETTAAVLAAKLRQHQVNPERLTAANLSTQLTLVAPVSGIVTAIRSNVGAAVQPGTTVCEVTDLSKLHADLWVFEQDILKVKNGQRVSLSFPAEPTRSYPATIYSLDKVLDPAKRAIRAHARLDSGAAGQSNFVNGAFLEASIATTGGGTGNALPDAAVVREGEDDFIFILEKEDAKGSFFKKIKVQKGGVTDGYVAVTTTGSIARRGEDCAEGGVLRVGAGGGRGGGGMTNFGIELLRYRFIRFDLSGHRQKNAERSFFQVELGF
ncbi:MAG: efflux RND transporter periplasmic adaptor subunit [Saprospiraceae bacterium]|nr:efflux RND transporter periplasmic adaptor subunit [Saprospiraceae bacterium]